MEQTSSVCINQWTTGVIEAQVFAFGISVVILHVIVLHVCLLKNVILNRFQVYLPVSVNVNQIERQYNNKGI